MTPAVTVLLPVRDGAPFLADAIASVRAQTFPDWRLLVLDDGSTDDSVGVAHAAFGADRARSAVVLMGRRGLTATLRAGVEMTGAPWLARLDADDWMAPDRLAEQMAQVATSPEYVVLGSATEERTPAGARLLRMYPYQDAGCRTWLNRGRNPFAHSAVLMSRAAVIAAGNYDLRWTRCQDLDLWLRMARRPGRLGNLAQALTVRRRHPAQRSQQHWRRRWATFRLLLTARRRGDLPIWGACAA